MSLSAAHLGFDESKVTFALRTSLSAVLALLIAWVIGLDHPQWAAMSVWAASLPIREQLLAKGAFRVLGTIAGTVVGVLLVQAYKIEPALLVIGLAAWVSLCTWATNLQRGFLAYATVLSGYTAAMVALVDIHNTDTVLALGADRLATVLTGVAVATLAGLLFAPRGVSGAGLRASVRSLIADILDRMAEQARQGRAHSPDSTKIARIAGIEEGLDSQFPGSRRETRSTRAVLIAAMAVLLQRGGKLSARLDCAENLTAAAEHLRERRTPEAAARIAQSADLALSHAPGVAEALQNLSEALLAWEPKAGAITPGPSLPITLHRDWIGARQAAMRAALALGLAGALWLVTGWSAGNFLLLGLSIMISIFSTFENPAQMMRPVIAGQVCAIIAVFICRWLIWPYLGAEWQLVATLIPFILFGSLLVAHSKTGALSFDYNMVFLLLMQPDFPLSGSIGDTAFMAFAVILGPLAALIVYRVIYPTDLGSRRETLLRMMQRDLADLARAPKAWENRNSWRARLYHRTLRLIRLEERRGASREEAVALSEKHLRLGHMVMQLKRHLASPLSPSDRRAIDVALGRMARIESDPVRAETALEHTVSRLSVASV